MNVFEYQGDFNKAFSLCFAFVKFNIQCHKYCIIKVVAGVIFENGMLLRLSLNYVR